MTDFTDTAPASRDEIKRALTGLRDAAGYESRKVIREWLADDPQGEKAAWVKGS